MISYYKRFVCGFCIAISLSGCSLLTPHASTETTTSPTWEARVAILTPLTTWHIQGGIAYSDANTHFSSLANWQHTPNDYRISLFSTLGSQSAHIIGSSQSVTLSTSDGKRATARTPEALLQSELGWSLPISNLSDWIRGIPNPNAPYQKTLDTENRLATLNQNGWNITYTEYKRFGPYDLPTKMTLTHQGIKIKVFIKDW